MPGISIILLWRNDISYMNIIDHFHQSVRLDIKRRVSIKFHVFVLVISHFIYLIKARMHITIMLMVYDPSPANEITHLGYIVLHANI